MTYPCILANQVPTKKRQWTTDNVETIVGKEENIVLLKITMFSKDFFIKAVKSRECVLTRNSKKLQ